MDADVMETGRTRRYASGEDYLEAVLLLQRKRGAVRSVDVARHLGVAVCRRPPLLRRTHGYLIGPAGSVMPRLSTRTISKRRHD